MSPLLTILISMIWFLPVLILPIWLFLYLEVLELEAALQSPEIKFTAAAPDGFSQNQAKRNANRFFCCKISKMTKLYDGKSNLTNYKHKNPS